MADFIDHVHQANHNQICAAKFLADPVCRDWSITAAFYSAVHFVEAGFSITEIVHSEQTRPRDADLHTYRQSMVRKKFGDTAWISYRKLQDASYNVRYLALWQSSSGDAMTNYLHGDAVQFVENDLVIVKKEVQGKSGLKLE